MKWLQSVHKGRCWGILGQRRAVAGFDVGHAGREDRRGREEAQVVNQTLGPKAACHESSEDQNIVGTSQAPEDSLQEARV
jgi:hypothetical protein